MGSLNDSPTFTFDQNEALKFWHAFEEPTHEVLGLTDGLLMDLFTEVIVPQTQKLGEENPAYMTGCSWIEHRRKNIWLRMLNKELIWFRGFGKNYYALPARW
jgi:hypothetical protein